MKCSHVCGEEVSIHLKSSFRSRRSSPCPRQTALRAYLVLRATLCPCPEPFCSGPTVIFKLDGNHPWSSLPGRLPGWSIDFRGARRGRGDSGEPGGKGTAPSMVDL